MPATLPPRPQKPAHIKTIGYYNHNDYQVSVSVNGVQYPVQPGQPILDTSNLLVEYHPELETAASVNVIRRIDPTHHIFKNWNSQQHRGETVTKFEDMTLDQIKERGTRDTRTPQEKASGKAPPTVAVTNTSGNVSLPEDVTMNVESGIEQFTFDGKKFSSIASIEIYKKAKGSS
jgi:hypothetical protein